MGKKKFRYHYLSDDVVTTHTQNYHLPDTYSIFPTSLGSKIWSAIIRPTASIISLIYTKLIMDIRIAGANKLHTVAQQGYFIYGNHTQPFGDVILPLSIIPARKYYAIGSQANWGIPILGKLVLPYFGLPVGQTVKQTANLIHAVKYIIHKNKVVVIYPEAHVWPYYTKIRPFPSTSMHFPIMLNAPSFVMTTTYSKPKHGMRPQITVYLDGPYYSDLHLSQKMAQQKLHDQIYLTMKKRAAQSNYEYYTYEKI
ncbi:MULTISPECIES: 1-acyl-sn-glycerol-3-phosphate acyltransferase [unclassified Lactobacillus]|uniref:1-acyl-sn-glycerol-3-phosphate acyltransferase n=1 Tax=unclassified Lactobacillus TaxID=2620435 RepID=UPI000EFAEDFA|nr:MULTISPECIES: 1-acyl-sn-glycerol-3-phosphate acyltransferase [unclassified Lactobacillus]RMC26008.1 1-acyl-sn-glycerol-3-phosphate acyltransferase [Lactobacillus sp. ESL0247]RMC29701.1 1-acyl-sn-glycerol-3-phosphate acyltransferase [Lactobacillus sp. ESL0246]RMC34106.1 1-acyl-sn-glycerol-3-phosphate acyltransferase [Lactobacillus sp. ESL0245]